MTTTKKSLASTDRAWFCTKVRRACVPGRARGGRGGGIKVLGTDVPGLFAAGTFYYHAELVFWDVRHPERAIIVSLQHERFKKLIVEVDDPHETVTRLRQAIETNKA